MSRLVSGLGCVVMGLGVVAFCAAILWVVKWPPSALSGPFGYVAAFAFGAFFGLCLGYGGYWYGTGTWAPSPSGFYLHLASLIVAAVTAPLVFFVFAMLTSRGADEWALWTCTGGEALVVVVAIALGVRDASRRRGA